MGNQNYRNLLDIIQGTHGTNYFLAAIWVKHGGRFIQDDTLRMHGNHSGYGNTLLLSPGKLIRGILTELIHANSLKAFFHPLPDLLCRYSQILRSKANILFHHLSDDLVIRILEYHSRLLTNVPQMCFICGIHAIDPHGSLCWIQDRIDMLRQCRFSRTVVP